MASPSDKTPPRSGGNIFGNNQTRREAAGIFRITRPRREAAEKFRSYKNPVFPPLEGPFEGFFVPKFGTLLFRKLGMVRRHLFILAAMQQTFSCLHLYFMTLRVTNPTNDVLRPITERSRKIQTAKNRNPATLSQRTNPLTPSPAAKQALCFEPIQQQGPRSGPFIYFFFHIHTFGFFASRESLIPSSSKTKRNGPFPFGQRVTVVKVNTFKRNPFCGGRVPRHNFPGGGG